VPERALVASRGRARRAADLLRLEQHDRGPTAASAAGGIPMSTTARAPVCSTPGRVLADLREAERRGHRRADAPCPSGMPVSADSPTRCRPRAPARRR
jgi:hypothetical protein